MTSRTRQFVLRDCGLLLPCMHAAAALGQSERVAEIRAFCAQGLTATANILAGRFEKEMRARRLSRKLSAKVRGRALVDLMQGILIRAKAGVPRKELLEDARSYASQRSMRIA
jgi:hypothetical protein